MKKTLILLGALTMGYTYAQEGKVGVNTDAPQATLDITPSNTNIAGTTNEGILAPRLSKERIANIATPVEGTLVYATDANYGGTNVAVSKITEKGYYFYNGTEWVKAGAGSALSSNIYTADGSTNGDRTVSTANGFLTVKGNAWNPLVVNSEIVPGDPANNSRGGLAVHPNDIEKRVEFATTKDGDSRIWLDGDKLFIKRATGAVGIGNVDPKAKLDVSGEILARGLDDNQVYIGGDATPATPERTIADIEIGSLKAGVNDVSLYNRTDAKAMNLFANDLNAAGNVRSNTLAGDGDKIVIANNDGTLVKGVSISNFATSNIYTADGTLTGDRTVDQAGKWLDFNNGGIRITGNDGVYFPLSINTKHSGGNGGIAINPNGDGAKRVELNSTPEGDFRLWADGDKIYVNRSTGNVGLSVGTNPAARLDVSGELIARGQTGQIEAYFGGDGVGGDVEVGSIKSGVTDVTLYNRGDSKAMNLVSGNVDARGTIKSTTLSGDGDKIVIANNDGTLVKGVSISNFATSNIYTADGTLTGDRTVDTGSNDLTIRGNSWFPLIVQSTIDAGAGNKASGGIAIYADDFAKRVEFTTTKDGDFRLWGGTGVSKLYIDRATGNTGIGFDNPKAKLDVSGGVRALQGVPAGDATDLGYAFGNDGDTGLFATADPINNNVGTGLDLYLNNVSRLNINQQGDVKVTNLAGDGDKIVVANNDGTLVKGVSISNFATSNIYTADGTLTADRNVNQEGKWLNFKNGGVNITGHTGNYFPLVINTMHSEGNGGISMQPNGDQAKRVELDTTPEGNFRLWLDGDKIFVNRSVGHVGIGTNTPTQRLDVYGNGKFFHPNQSTIVHLDTSDNMWTHLDFRRNNVKRWDVGMTDTQNYFINSFKDNGDYHQTPFFIDRTTGNIAIHNVNPSEALDVAGSIKSRDLAGTGNRNVVADANGKLVIGEATSNVRESNTSTTLTEADNNGYVYMTGAGTVTVPSSLPQGFSCIVVQQVAGDAQVTIAGDGVTLRTARGLKTRTQYSAVGIIKRVAGEATITGDAVNQ